MKEYCPGTKLFPGFHREVAYTKQKAGQKKRSAAKLCSRKCVEHKLPMQRDVMVTRFVLCLSLSSSLWSIRVLFPFLSLSLSLSLFLSLSRPPARIFFFNLIYRQFDGRKTRRHFCLSPYSPAGPGPSFHPHVARRKAIKIHNPGHTPRG